MEINFYFNDMKKLTLFFILFVFYSFESSYAQNKSYQNDYKKDTIKEISFHTDSLIQFANKFIGLPYKSSGKTPDGFDCSGFSHYCFKNYGINLPYSATEQAKLGKEILKEEAEAGDLIFFRGKNNKDKKVHHVGIIVNKKGENLNFIHSSSRGVCIDSIGHPYYKPRFIKIKRLKR